MNRTHRSLWNRALGAWVAAPENARARGKCSRVASGCALTAAILCTGMPAAHACTAGSTAELAACITGNDAIIDLTASITLSGHLPVLERDLTINGTSFTGQRFVLDGAGQFRGFFIGSGTTTVNGLTMQNLRAQGGHGSPEVVPGGGGMGAGAAVFVVTGAGATLNDVTVVDNSAIGGNGGSVVRGDLSVGGGGGMGGNGGATTGANGAGRGGGGLFDDGGFGAAETGLGGKGGGPNGGAGGIGGSGGDGGAYTGGGGGAVGNASATNHGGSGGLGGGGGGAGSGNSNGSGGRGGFGGGGGGGYALGGAGGFGGGGGGSLNVLGGAGGFGGGNGGSGGSRRGGGGAGMGGAIFVMDGGMLTIGGNTEVRDNGVTGGARGGTGAQAGSAFGAGIFMQGTSSTLAFVPGAGATQTFADAIADQTGSGGTGANAGSILLVKGGDGRLVLSGTNTYSGGTRVTGGTLSISSDQNLGAVAGTLALDGGTLQTTAAVTTMRAITIENAARFQTDADLSATGVISGTGGLAKTGTGTLTLAGANTYGGGTSLWGGKVSVSSDANLGAFGVLAFDGGTLQVTGTAFTSTPRFVIWGSDGGGFDIVESDATFSVGQALTKFGILSKEGAGTLVLSGANTYTGGTLISAGILAGGAGNFGSGAIANNAELRIDQSGDATFANTVKGSGTLTKTGTGALTLTGSNTYAGGTTVRQGLLSISADQNLGAASGPLNLDGGTLRTTGAFTTARSVNLGAGGGTLQTVADLAASGIVSGAGALTKTGAGTLTLTGINRYTGGTALQAGVTSVADNANLGDAAGGLVFNGGTLRTTGSITMNRATTLDAQGGAIDTLAGTTLTQQGAIGGAGALTKTGAGTLTLTGTNTYAGGTRIDAGSVTGNAAGFGSGAIINNAALLFDQPGDATFANALAGTGTLTKSGVGTLTLTGANNLAGGTTIAGGTLSVAADQNLGAASGLLTLDGGTLQTTAAVTTARAITIGSAGGSFRTDADLASTGPISGAGRLTKTGTSTLALTGTNTYTGGTTVSAGTLAGSASSFGSGAIANNAALLIEQPDDATLANTVTGSGVVTKTGAGTLTLSGENSYSGGTDLKEGRVAVRNNRALGTGELAMHEGTTLRFAADGLTLANSIAFTDAVDPIVDTGPFTATLTGAITGPGDLSKIGSGTLILSGASTYTGATAVTEGTLRAGVSNTFSPASAHSVAAGATLDLAGFSQSVAGLTNAGTVSLIGATPGTTLTVTGPYVGNNGLLRLGTFLGDSASASDRLVLSGPAAAASGNTTVQVVNLGGLGALTTGNGIELVSALNGATTTAQSTKDAFALQGGHVDAGAYEYRLQPGDAAGAGENWYLRSTSTIIPPVPPVPPAPGEPPAPAVPPSPVPAPAAAPIQVPTYRAEVPLFAALPEQLRQGNLAMLGNLHQRIGDDDVKTAAGEQGSATTPATGERRAWGRVLSTRLNIQQSGTVSPQSDGRLSGLQAGTDLWTAPHWRAGLYVGQLDGELQVKGFARGTADLAVGSNDLRSQYLGGYATYSNDSGFYADAVLQAGRHRYEVKPQTTLRTKGKGSSLSASLEIGQSFALGEDWQIEPQAQLVHQRLHLDDVDITGARVHQERDGNWLARVGVRVKGDIATSAGRLQPYARVNLYRASGGNDSTRFINAAANTAIASSTGSTSTELAAGFTLRLSESTSLYGELGKLWASGGDTRVKSQLNASAGLRVRW